MQIHPFIFIAKQGLACAKLLGCWQYPINLKLGFMCCICIMRCKHATLRTVALYNLDFQTDYGSLLFSSNF